MKAHQVLVLGLALVAASSAADQCGKRNSQARLMNSPRADKTNYIVGGEIALKSEFPWQTSIQVRDKTSSGDTTRKHICGASLINDRWVLTAANCILDDVQQDDYYMILGARRLDDIGYPMQSRGVQQIEMHPLWNKTTRQNDIALIKLDSRVSIREAYAAPICLPEATDASRFNGTCVTAGWGALYENTLLSPALVKVDLLIVHDDVCEKRYENVTNARINKDVICAGQDGAGPCQGDDGNALACEVNGVYYLAGITSSPTCGSSQYPAVFTRVSSFRKWIDVVIS